LFHHWVKEKVDCRVEEQFYDSERGIGGHVVPLNDGVVRVRRRGPWWWGAEVGETICRG
jgi:hypothetical protein